MHNTCVIRLGRYPNDPRVRKQVLALLEKDFKVDVLCLKTTSSQPFIERNGNLTLYRVPLKKIKSNSLIVYLFFYLTAFVSISAILNILFFIKRYKSIQVHTLPDYLAFTAIIPKILGTKIIIDFHEPAPELILTKFPTRRNNFLYKVSCLIEQYAIKFSDLSITVTKALKRRMIERGANEKKIKVVTNVIDESILVDENIIAQTNHGFNLITHGAIEKRYGHELVIRAVNLLKDKYPEIKYKIIGQGLYVDHLKNLVAELSCDKNVLFLGYLDFNELKRQLNLADAGIIAMYQSPYSELIDTNKMYEFISLKKPIIHSRLSPVTDNFDHSCFLYFEPGNYINLAECIEKLYLEPDLRTEMVKKALFKYENLKWSVVKKNYQNLIENLVTSKS